MKIIKSGKLTAKVFTTRAEMGKAAAAEAAAVLRELLAKQDHVNVIFAAAPSQNETLDAIAAEEGVDWTRVRAFHMDEYTGLKHGDPRCFVSYLDNRIFGRLPFACVNYIRGDAPDAAAECRRYSELLKKYPADIVMLGIGENGHIAFNDPHVADFSDPVLVKEVTLDEVCRMQQVNDGCFATLGEVPLTALTLTVPALMRARYLFCSVPAATKADAVRNTLYGEISEKCPATVMRTHDGAVLYCDADSGKYIL